MSVVRIRRVVLGTLAVAVVGWPALQLPPGDGFPLSSYPMFANDRGRTAAIHVAVALLRSGGEERLGPADVAETDEVMTAAETLRYAVADPRRAAGVCHDIARRVAQDRPIAGVELRTERYDTFAWYEGRREPLSSTVRAQCRP